MENMTAAGVSSSQITFYQSEIFGEQRFRETLYTAIGDRMT
jgi:hypothetical protein